MATKDESPFSTDHPAGRKRRCARQTGASERERHMSCSGCAYRANLYPPSTRTTYRWCSLCRHCNCAASLSDTGYLCDVSIVKGMEPAIDREARSAIQQQVFQPIKIGDKAIAGSMLVFRDYWRGDNSDLLFGENADAATDEVRSEPTDSDLSSLLRAAKIDGSRYENPYFGVAFSADGA